MEKYQKLLSFIILLAFFIAISFYLQKATETLQTYVSTINFGGTWQQSVSKVVFSWVTNFVQ
jgi:hypothetical protein